MSYAHQLLSEILQAQGLPAAQAQALAERLMGSLVAAEIVSERALEIWDRDARIYHLRGQRVTAVVLAARFDMARSKVFEAIRKHAQRRRAALKASA